MLLAFSKINYGKGKQKKMYKMTEDKIMEDCKEYITYGIWYDDEFHVKDVSLNKKEVEELVQLCNDGNLHPIHLYDVVEDVIVR